MIKSSAEEPLEGLEGLGLTADPPELFYACSVASSSVD